MQWCTKLGYNLKYLQSVNNFVMLSFMFGLQMLTQFRCVSSFRLHPWLTLITHVNIWFACWLLKKVCTKIIFLFIVISRFDSLNSESPKSWVNDLVVDLWFGDSDFRFSNQGLAPFICFRQLTLVTALYAGAERVADCPTKQTTATTTWFDVRVVIARHCCN